MIGLVATRMTSDPGRENAEAEPHELGRYLRPVLRRWWLVLGVVVLGTVATYLFFDNQARRYRATTVLYFKPSELQSFLDTTSDFGTDRAVQNQAGLLKASDVAQEFARRIGYRGDPKDLLGHVTVRPRPGQDFVDLTYEDSAPRLAAQRANTYATAFNTVQSGRTRSQLRRTQAAIRAQLAGLPRRAGATGDQRDELRARLQQLDALAALPVSNAQQVARATTPTRASFPRPVRDAVFAFALSLLLAIALALGLERFDRVLRRLDDVESVYEIPLLAAVPHVRDVSPEDRDGTRLVPARTIEAMRTLRVNLELAMLDSRMRHVLVVSAKPAEGKSVVVRNLALALAEAGKRVAVVECDLRRPTLSSLFGLDEGPGLSDVLVRSVSLEDALAPVAVAAPMPSVSLAQQQAANGSVALAEEAGAGSIHVLRAGPTVPNPPAVLASEPVRRLLDELGESHDIVLIDSPPLLNVSDAMPLLGVADGAVVVTRIGRSTRDAGRQLMKLLPRVPGAHVAGVVANDVKSDEALTGGYYFTSPYAPPALADAPGRRR